jgi:hypothetical protein
MNAVKTLLTAKSVAFGAHHGVGIPKANRGKTMRDIASEEVEIKSAGVLPSLSVYLGETEALRVHTLKELFFNLPYIHRTYCLTYTQQTDMYIPFTECQYVCDKTLGRAFLRATLSKDFSAKRVIKRLRPAFVIDADCDDGRTVRSATSVSFGRPRRPTDADLANLTTLNRQVRNDLYYITLLRLCGMRNLLLPARVELSGFR